MSAKRLTILAVLLIGLALMLSACGNDATSTPLPATTPANVNPIIATITAGVAGKSGASAVVTPGPTLVAPVSALPGVPLYSNLKPINLGVYGSQIAIQFSQASPNARTAFYGTSDSFDKLSGFYNSEMTKQGYTKLAEQPLPASSSLDGKVLLYNKDTTNLVVMGLGPLDASLIATLSQASSSASTLKPGDTLVILLNGLTPTNLSDLQKTLGGQ